MGGKFHLKLNIDERPIANKYREGKMKRTLKRELKSAWNCWEGSDWRVWVRLGLCISNELLYVLDAGQHGLAGRDNSMGWYRVYAVWLIKVWLALSPSGTASTRCWQKPFNRPVLKHGPRSLTSMQVFWYNFKPLINAQWKRRLTSSQL